VNIAKRVRQIITTVILVLGLAACGQQQKATPQPTGTAEFYESLRTNNLVGLDYMSPKGAVQLGGLVCDSLRANRSVMWVIKNIVTLNGANTPPNFTPEDRTKFAMGIIAGSVTHLCPDQKDYVLSPEK